MTEAEINLLVDELRNIGGQYAQAKHLLKELPEDIKRALYSRRRTKYNVRIRRKLIVILKDRFDLSFPAIGELLNYADHTSVIHHYYRAKKCISKREGTNLITARRCMRVASTTQRRKQISPESSIR